MDCWLVNNGATWEALAYAAETRGFQVVDLFGDSSRYRRWTVDSLVAETAAGNAAMILVRYRALPGRQSATYRYNHYIVVLGAGSDGSIVYHDPAYPDAATGSYLRMSRRQLDAAWSSETSGIVYTGMAVKPKKK
jgi:hypothetical protein